jgi:hypothetical protein
MKLNSPHRGGEFRGLETAADESFASLHEGVGGDYGGKRISLILFIEAQSTSTRPHNSSHNKELPL